MLPLKGILIFTILLSLFKTTHAAVSEGRYCWSCMSTDAPYVSRYTEQKSASALACNDPFEVPPSNLVLMEKLLECTEYDGQFGTKTRYCIKVAGFDRSSRQNVTARGCFRSKVGFEPDREDVVSSEINFGQMSIVGTAYFCDGNGCNLGHLAVANALSVLVAHSISLLLRSGH